LLSQPHIGAVLAGMVLVGIGTFFAQAIVTGYVSRIAGDDRAAATGTYLAAYFTGGLAGAAVIGKIFDLFGWDWCLATIAGAVVLATLLAGLLNDEPLTERRPLAQLARE
jgi:YNFM family putative membrane transporter